MIFLIFICNFARAYQMKKTIIIAFFSGCLSVSATFPFGYVSKILINQLTNKTEKE